MTLSHSRMFAIGCFVRCYMLFWFLRDYFRNALLTSFESVVIFCCNQMLYIRWRRQLKFKSDLLSSECCLWNSEDLKISCFRLYRCLKFEAQLEYRFANDMIWRITRLIEDRISEEGILLCHIFIGFSTWDRRDTEHGWIDIVLINNPC